MYSIADLRKQYRFLKKHKFNEEVFKVKVKHYLDADISKITPTIMALQDEDMLLMKEEIYRLADEIYTSETLIDTIKENIKEARDARDFDCFDINYLDWSDIVNDPFDNIMKQLFPSTYKYLNQFGLEDYHNEFSLNE